MDGTADSECKMADDGVEVVVDSRVKQVLNNIYISPVKNGVFSRLSYLKSTCIRDDSDS